MQTTCCTGPLTLVSKMNWPIGTPPYITCLQLFVCHIWDMTSSLLSRVSLQRNGGLFGNHVNHASANLQGSSHPTTVTQRPLQILPFPCSASSEPTQTGIITSDNDRGRGAEMNSLPNKYNHHYHTPHPSNYSHCNVTCQQSPIPSNANLNNANVPSLLSTNNGRQKKCFLRRDRPSSTKTGSPVSMYSRPWKSHSIRSVAWAQKGISCQILIMSPAWGWRSESSWKMWFLFCVHKESNYNDTWPWQQHLNLYYRQVRIYCTVGRSHWTAFPVWPPLHDILQYPEHFEFKQMRKKCEKNMKQLSCLIENHHAAASDWTSSLLRHVNLCWLPKCTSVGLWFLSQR